MALTANAYPQVCASTLVFFCREFKVNVTISIYSLTISLRSQKYNYGEENISMISLQQAACSITQSRSLEQ